MTSTPEPTTLTELLDKALTPDDWPTGLPNAGVMEAIGEGGAADLREQHAAELEAWRIDGERTALWAANKLAMAEARIAEALETARKLYAIADEHQADIAARTAWDINYFTARLREYHTDSIKGSRRKTTPLPGGTKLKSGLGSVTTEIDDEKALADFLEDRYPSALEYPDPKVVKAELRKLDGKLDDAPGDYPLVVEVIDAATGEITPEIVPGAHFTRKPERFTVELGDGPEPDDE
jgi:hypothetical protein